MKKLFIAILLLIGITCVSNARQEEFIWPKISFEVAIKKPVTVGNPLPRNPVTTPDVYLDDHTLYIDSIGYDSTIQLTDETGTIVYSISVSEGTTLVVLPSTLTGTYGLSLIPETGNYFFYGEISL